MQNFIETENIARFKALLVTENDPHKRDTLLKLLEAEEAKHAETIKAAKRQ